MNAPHIIDMAREVELRQQCSKYEAALKQIVRLDETGTSDVHVRESMGIVASTALRPDQPNFPNVSCSSCGTNFGPGDFGFSHCEHHAHLPPVRVPA